MSARVLRPSLTISDVELLIFMCSACDNADYATARRASRIEAKLRRLLHMSKIK